MDERNVTRSEASRTTLDIFTVFSEAWRVGVDSAEIERVVSGSGAFEAASGDNPARGGSYRLEELLSGARALERAADSRRASNRKVDRAHRSVFVLASESGRTGLVAFDGVMDVMKIPVARILPVPAFVRRAQRPFFVWGFYPAAEGLITLVTFCYLAQEGAA